MRDFYGVTLPNALMLGTAQYPSPSVLQEAFRASGAGVAPCPLRREAGQASLLVADPRHGRARAAQHRRCHSAREAETTARMAREVFETDWIKLE